MQQIPLAVPCVREIVWSKIHLALAVTACPNFLPCVERSETPRFRSRFIDFSFLSMYRFSASLQASGDTLDLKSDFQLSVTLFLFSRSMKAKTSFGISSLPTDFPDFPFLKLWS